MVSWNFDVLTNNNLIISNQKISKFKFKPKNIKFEVSNSNNSNLKCQIIFSDIPENGKLKNNSVNLDNMMNNKKTSDNDMTQSDAGFTTWSQLKKSSDFIQMQR